MLTAVRQWARPSTASVATAVLVQKSATMSVSESVGWMAMLEKIKNPHCANIICTVMVCRPASAVYRPGCGLAILINGCKDAYYIHVEELGEMVTSKTVVIVCGAGAV